MAGWIMEMDGHDLWCTTESSCVFNDSSQPNARAVHSSSHYNNVVISGN